MRATNILGQVFRELESNVHLARLRAVTAAVTALVTGGAIALSALGRAVARKSKVKHGIKRIDRLLGNLALTREVESFYGAIIHRVLLSTKRPVILVDWTELPNAVCALTAAVPCLGRALAIYTVTCPEKKLSNPAVEYRFLKTLQRLLPSDCTPILVTDAGFRSPWFRRVRALGWDYVGRVRGGVMVRSHDGEGWKRAKALFALARRTPHDLGSWQLVKSSVHVARLITVDKRSRRARGPARQIRRKISERRCATASREPWLLVTSLSECAADQVVSIYKKRMQIEETFRDLKSHRFGWGFDSARSRHPARVAIQILLAALASLVALLVGHAAYAADAHKAFQANTVSCRRVLSLVTLGRLVLARTPSRLAMPPALASPFTGLHEFVGIP